MGNFISKIIRLGLLLAALGQLKAATLYFMREAAREQQRGLISLSALNHALMDQPARHIVTGHHIKNPSPKTE